MRPRGNPFSTRYVRPGAVEFIFPPGESAHRLVQQLCQANWWGQILGPHGSGKTTLLHTLGPRLEELGRELHWFTLHSGQRHVPYGADSRGSSWHSKSLIVVDGYEQLGWVARWALKSRCRQTGAGLLATSHRDVGLPTIVQLNASLSLVERLINELLDQAQLEELGQVDLPGRFRSCKGNVRELLFGLYDLYESSRLFS